MNLVRMSFSASVMIIMIIILRAFLINKLPKKTFLALWAIVILRLLIPFSFPSTFSIYFLISQSPTIMNKIVDTPVTHLLPIYSYEQIENSEIPAGGKAKENTGKNAANKKQNKEQAIDNSHLMIQEAGEVQKETGIEKDRAKSGTQIPETNHPSVWMVIWGIGFFICTIMFSVIYFL